MIPVVALAAATIVPLAFLYVVKALDFYQTGSWRFIAMSAVWGALAYMLAGRINTAFVDRGVVSVDTLVRFLAPVVEEVLKGLILLYLIRHADFKYFLDGAIYGFAIGIGFAILENYEYVMGHPSTAIQLALSRVLSTNLIHATGSAMIGIALGLARFDRSAFRRGLYLLTGLALAIGIHSGFNNMVDAGVALLFAFAAGIGGAAIIYGAIQRGLREEKTWVRQEIGLTEGVTSGEASAVRQLSEVDRILTPVAQRFGAAKAAQIEKLLFMQAQLALQRKMLEKMQDPKMKAAIEAQAAELDRKMNASRKSVGAWCMLYLRNIFPDNDIQLWDMLQTRVSTDKSQAGGGVWLSLEERMKPKPKAEQDTAI